jgi:hypothetical protein
MTKLIVAFRKFANAPKSDKLWNIKLGESVLASVSEPSYSRVSVGYQRLKYRKILLHVFLCERETWFITLIEKKCKSREFQKLIM